MQLYTRKGNSPILQQSFDVQIAWIRCIAFELCVSKKKNKVKIFMFDFLDCQKDWWKSVSIFYIRTAIVSCIRVLYHFAVLILKLLPYLKYKTQFWTTNPYLRSNIIFLVILGVGRRKRLLFLPSSVFHPDILARGGQSRVLGMWGGNLSFDSALINVFFKSRGGGT